MALPTAPYSARVDLVAPTFSQPTSITNPLFAISALTQVIQVGAEAGQRLRHEITLLPWTKTVEWLGQDVETLVSQFVAYRDGRILEVACDYFAQADDGSVWYFGEEVDNYEDGVIVDHEGTWLAGKDGPPGMIMPAEPAVGDVYRPENIPGFVFEEVTVKSVGARVEGPSGPVDNSVLVNELLMDGTREDKVFTPGYGEFRAEVPTEGEIVTVAIATPTDAVPGAEPQDLRTMLGAALRIVDAVAIPDWAGISAHSAELAGAWGGYSTQGIPPLIREQLDVSSRRLTAAADGRNPDDTWDAAIEVAEATLDLQLRHRPVAAVDMGRLDLHTRQILAAVATEEVVVEASALQAIWTRTAHTVDDSARDSIGGELAELAKVSAAGDLGAAATSATALHATLTDLLAAQP